MTLRRRTDAWLWIGGLVLLLLGSAAHARLAVGLVTIAPGEAIWQRYGHNALLLVDADRGTSTLYNYGLFDFEQENFLQRFVAGDMLYSMAGSNPARDLQIYAYEGRRVTVQWLRLDPADAERLQTFLEWNRQPENADYAYDYFLDNCSTRVRDALDRVLDGQLKVQWSRQVMPTTYRVEALRHMAGNTLFTQLMDIGLGRKTDTPISAWHAAFVPQTLAMLADSGGALDVERSEVPVDLPDNVAPLAVEQPWWLYAGTGLVIAAGLIAGRRRRVARWVTGGWWFISGACGLSLALLWAASGHWASWENENLLLLNPLAWLAWFALGQRFQRLGRIAVIALVAMSLFALVGQMTPWLVQQNTHWILALVPINIAAAVVSLAEQRPRRLFAA